MATKLNPGRVQAWSDREVLARWTTLFTGPLVVQRSLQGKTLSLSEQAQVNGCLETWRSRLSSLSWFMRCLNEYIARMANAEDGCTGHFWESRFKSQALLDEIALLTAMAYVDLNPFRAGIAETIENSDYTSGQDRLNEVTKVSTKATPGLLPFEGHAQTNGADGLPFNLQDYLDLLDTTGRCVVPGKRGAIDPGQPRLLKRRGVETNEWLATVTQLQQRYEFAIGAPGRLQALATRWGKRWVWGLREARRLYPIPSG